MGFEFWVEGLRNFNLGLQDVRHSCAWLGTSGTRCINVAGLGCALQHVGVQLVSESLVLSLEDVLTVS